MVDAQLTQDDAITFVESIGETLGLTKVNDSMGVSYYGISENTVVRIADHSTYLQTWIDHDTYEKENKYSIVIEVNPSKPNPIVNRNVELFIVKEFKHKLKKLNGDAVVELANAIKGAIGSGGQFSNPFKVKTRLIASKYQPPQNDNQQSTQDASKQNITNNQQDTNMQTENRKRNVVRLTESQLKQIVAESVKKVLNEDYNHHSDYMEAKRILDGKTLEEIQQIVQNDKRFSYGSLNGTEGEGLIDLNFKSILLTVKLIGKVLPFSEEYDSNDQFIDVKRRY